MGKSALRNLFAVLALLIGAGAAFAQPAEEPSGEAMPLGGESVDRRVRERERMRLEYEEMRKKRAEALAKARDDASGTAGSQVPGWKGSDGSSNRAARLAALEEEAQAAKKKERIRRLEGTPRILLFLAIGLLGFVIFMWFRGRRGP